MGRIKSLMIKRTANQLLDGEHIFKNDFEHNKKVLGNTMPSKPVRNRIAGYIGRLIKNFGKKKEKKIVVSEDYDKEKSSEKFVRRY